MKKLILFLMVTLSIKFSYCQEIKCLKVTDQNYDVPGLSTIQEITMKDGTKRLNYPRQYFSLLEGDKIYVTIKTENKKGTQQFYFVEYESKAKLYSESSFQNIDSLEISIPKTGIYYIETQTTHFFDRTCRLKLYRLPMNKDKILHNTNVVWKTVIDTSYSIQKVNEIEKSDTIFSELKNEKVYLAAGKKLNLTLMIPESTNSLAIFIGSNGQGKEAWENAINNLTSNQTAKLLGITNPLHFLALTGVQLFSTKLIGGDEIDYTVYQLFDTKMVDQNNNVIQDNKIYANGIITSTATRISNFAKGYMYVKLYNNNILDPIDVDFKVGIVQIKNVYRTIDKKIARYNEKMIPVSQN